MSSIPRQGRALAVAVLAFVTLAGISTPTQAEEGDVLSGACEVVLDIHRVGNTINITTEAPGSLCVTNAGVGFISIEGSVDGVVGWTCAGGVALGGVTITVEHDGGSTVAGNVIAEVSSVAGAVNMGLVRSTHEGDVVGEAALVELVTGPIACVVNNEFAVWRGPLTFTIAE